MSIRTHGVPSRSGYAITASASAQPRRSAHGIYVGATGNVVVKYEVGGPDVTFVGVPAGTILPIAPAVISTCASCVNL